MVRRPTVTSGWLAGWRGSANCWLLISDDKIELQVWSGVLWSCVVRCGAVLWCCLVKFLGSRLLSVAGERRRVVSSSAAALLPPHEGEYSEHQNINPVQSSPVQEWRLKHLRLQSMSLHFPYLYITILTNIALYLYQEKFGLQTSPETWGASRLEGRLYNF